MNDAAQMAEAFPRARTRAERVDAFLRSPWVDQYLAWAMAIIGVRLLWASAAERQGLPLFLLLAQGLAHNVLLVLRRAPKRVSLNPWFWIVPVVGANWHLMYGLARGIPGRAIAPGWATDALSIIGALLFIWARLSLGRNFGITPAEREIVGSGPYRFVRHPIYSSSILLGLGQHLSHFSAAVLAIWLAGVGIVVVKALMEESFLRPCEEYQRYSRAVRWRFFPFL